MADLKLELPREIPAAARAELLRELEASARLSTPSGQKPLDPVQILFVIAATVQTADILWRWYQAWHAKNERLDVVMTDPQGRQWHLRDVTWDELRQLMTSGG